jgi:hypothetical protein
MIKDTHRSAVKKPALRSTAQGVFRTPLTDLPLTEGGGLSIFSTDEKPTTQFNFSTFLANNIHEQFVNFAKEGMFWYSSILAYLFVFFQAKKFVFSM